MGHIVVKNVQKTYQVALKEQGLLSSLKHFVKPQYKAIEALQDISFEIEPGELVGYIGPNGAGKSTTVKVMSGILVPDSGRCEVNGITPWKKRKEHVKDIGVVFGQRSQLWWDIPVSDTFDILKDIYKIPSVQYQKHKNELIERLDIGGFLTVPVRQLSLGQRMRCELAASLLHNPSTLFLDEPTIGLDAVSKLKVRAFIKDINKAYKTTVILTTHDMDDIEALCNRTMIIGSGRILHDGSIRDLRKMVTEERRLTIDFARDYGQVDHPGLTLKTKEGNRWVFAFNPETMSPSKLINQLTSDYEIKDFLVENASIEEIIADLYKVLSL